MRPAKAGPLSGRQTHRGKSRNPVAWVAGWRETETLKPTDEAIERVVANHQAVARANVRQPRNQYPEVELMGFEAKTAELGEADRCAELLRRGGNDGMVTRVCRATGDTLLVPMRNHRSKVGRITGNTGKAVEGEREADGPEVAITRGNARRAKGPCCS